MHHLKEGWSSHLPALNRRVSHHGEEAFVETVEVVEVEVLKSAHVAH